MHLLTSANARQLAIESASFFLWEKVLIRKLAWEALGTTASLYKPLDENDIPRIADAALEVLEKSGMAVYSDTAFEAFRVPERVWTATAVSYDFLAR